MTYDSICKKIGFDPLVDGYKFKISDHEDDRQVSPFAPLTLAELDFLADYIKKHR